MLSSLSCKTFVSVCPLYLQGFMEAENTIQCQSLGSKIICEKLELKQISVIRGISNTYAVIEMTIA